jgi:hypothetical protein
MQVQRKYEHEIKSSTSTSKASQIIMEMRDVLQMKPKIERNVKKGRRLYQPIIQRQSADDRLIPLTPFLEFFHIQMAVLVLVHHAKDFLDSFFGRVFVFGEFDHGADLQSISNHPFNPGNTGKGAYHLIYSLHNSQHLIVTYLPIAINIVQLKRPIQFILHLAARRHGQRAYEFFEINGAAVVGIKDAKDIVCEGGWVAEGEKLAVDLLEFFFVEVAGGAVFEEA